MSPQFSKQKGFTLIETLVVITILIIGVLGPLALAARGISDGLYIQNELAANYLAQEAMETILSSRNAAVGDPANPKTWSEWLATLPVGCNAPATNGSNACGVNTVTGAVVLGCDDSGAACSLQFDNTSNVQRYIKAGTAGILPLGPAFNRAVYLTMLPSGSDSSNSTELKVTVVMNWANKNIPRTIVFTQHISPRQ